MSEIERGINMENNDNMLDNLISSLIIIQEGGFQLLEAKKQGIREVSIDDHIDLFNYYVDMTRHYIQMYEWLNESEKDYKELSEAIKIRLGIKS